LFNLFFGCSNWFSRFINDSVTLSILKLTFIVDQNKCRSIFFFFLKNLVNFCNLFFSLFVLISSDLYRFSILSLFDLFFGCSYWFSRFIDDNFALMILKLTLIVDQNKWSFSFFFFMENFTSL